MASKEVTLNVINVYNQKNLSMEELKLIFNKKFLDMIYKIEKNDIKIDGNMAK